MMAALGMSGPYDFTSETIDEVVTKRSAGNYALSYVKDGTFIVRYVGRSDSDVNGELKSKLHSKYKEFKYSYAASPKAAFDRECHNYHDFGESAKLDNEIHPTRLAGTTWRCPVCNVYG